MTAVVLLSVALVAALALCAYLAWLSNECRCASCAPHKLARRQKVEERRLKIERDQKANAERAHDYAHKGQGWKDGDADRFNCTNEACRRNRALD